MASSPADDGTKERQDQNFPFDLQASITVPVVPAVPIVPFVSRPRTCAARAPDEVVWESGGYSERRMGEASMHS